MTNSTASAAALEADDKRDAWQRAGFEWAGRKANLPQGFRLYTAANHARWLKGLPDRGDMDLGNLADLYRDLDLDNEPTETDPSAAYMSLTARLQRVREITYGANNSLCVRYPRPTRPPHLPPLHRDASGRWFLAPGHAPEWHGPSVEWRERTSTIWAAMPAHDSVIFPRRAETASPKLGHMAERLAPLLRYARARVSLSLNPTNWLQADNDSHSGGGQAAQKPATNRERRMRPGSSDAELKSFIKKAGPCREWIHSKLGGGGEIERTPIDAAWPSRAGKLRIANGETKAEGVRVPKGTILYQPDRFGELLGPEPDKDDVDLTRAWAARVYGRPRAMDGKAVEGPAMETSERQIDGRTFMVPRPFKPAGKIRRKVKLTREDQIALLATAPLPPVTYLPPGLPNGSADLRGIFTGGEIMSTKGKSGVERWEDVSDELSRQAEFESWAAALPPEEQRALNLACTAVNLREIGEAFGKIGKMAERDGKRRLQAANDNLKRVMAA